MKQQQMERGSVRPAESMSRNTTYIFKEDNFIDLTIYQFGSEQCVSMHSCGPAIHNHYILHYIIDGAGTLTVGSDHHYHLHAGQAFLICPKHVTTYVADKLMPWKYAWVEFDGLHVSTYLSNAGLGLNYPIYEPSSGENSAELEALFMELLKDHDNSLRLIGTMYYILETLIRTSASRKPPKVSNMQEFYVHEAMMYVERNYNRNIFVQELADWCNLDRSYFGKIFRDSVLMSPQEYIIRYRINLACDLLKNTDLPIGEVAADVGYENPTHFSRAFKKIMGTSPREWRRRIQFSQKV